MSRVQVTEGQYKGQVGVVTHLDLEKYCVVLLDSLAHLPGYHCLRGIPFAHLTREVKMPDSKLTCEVCEKNEAVGVAAIPSMPISAAFCKECLEAGAYPYNVLVAGTVLLLPVDEPDSDPFLYVGDFWEEMVEHTLQHLGKTKEQFAQDVRLSAGKLDKS